jgi:hypothetical protein
MDEQKAKCATTPKLMRIETPGSPGARNEDETLSTLKFASFARKPRTFTKRNEALGLRGGGEDVLALKLEVQALKQQLSLTAGGGGVDQVAPVPRLALAR